MDHNVAPFPRGQTWGDGTATLDDSTGKSFEGRVFEFPDTVHSTGQIVRLRCVKNDSGSAITAAYKLVKFSTTDALDPGRRIAGLSAAQGEICKPIDDAYSAGKSIVDDDLFYVLDSGPCFVKTEATAVSLSALDQVTSQGDGTLDGAVAADGDFVIGTLDAAASTTSANVIVHVNPGLGYLKG